MQDSIVQNVYQFGNGQADGSATMQELLGGKGANLAEMAGLGLPVPPGFTIATPVCAYFNQHDFNYPPNLADEVSAGLTDIEHSTGRTFGGTTSPLLVSVRSGAPVSMPGMMETVLNVGLTSDTLPGLIAMTSNEQFAWNCYLRLIVMYADVVMEKSAGIVPAEGQGIRLQLEEISQGRRTARNLAADQPLETDDYLYLADAYKAKIHALLGAEFPDDPSKQLWGAIGAVFRSWDGQRAIAYRHIENLSDEMGTAVTVQAMVFGNMGATSATGVAFTRNPATGDSSFFGEWLPNAQGEDVVAGIRTPNPINEASRPANSQLPSLESEFPELYNDLLKYRQQLEMHYRDMQDLEFTIEDGRLYLLQTRRGKRTGIAALHMAVEMCDAKIIDLSEALSRVQPSQVEEFLHPMVDPQAEAKHAVLARGLPAGPGGASGKIVLTPQKAQEWADQGEKVILVRTETSPEDVRGMHAAEAILTSRGGMTSHAALVARGWGKCCIVGAAEVEIDLTAGKIRVGDHTLAEGDTITLNGTAGLVYQGELPLIALNPTGDETFQRFMGWCDERRTLGVRANADSPESALLARELGAAGIGLCRTEHMFFEPERITHVRQMILADGEESRRRAIMTLLPYQKEDFRGILKAMAGHPVTIRLLDPPLHEFLPQEPEAIANLAGEMGVSLEELTTRIERLSETNPMLGHRGCRLGISYPEITEMQARAILEAAAELVGEGIEAKPEIMIPLVGHYRELANQRKIIERLYADVRESIGEIPGLLIGTMIEVPRGALTADEIAMHADFFSFGTNDLTQMACGFSRDDSAGFLPDYVERGFYEQDPFQSIDQTGVGELVRIAIEKGRGAKGDIHLGVCGEHGGDPDSIHFFHRVGLDYVSCSPYRVPVARLAAAQAAMQN